MKEFSGSRETAKMIEGAHKNNLGSSNKENLGSGEQRVKFLMEQGAGDPPCRASVVSIPVLNI